MARRTQEAPASSGTRRTTRSQRGTQSDAPTQVQKGAASKRKAPAQPTPPSSSKRTKQRAAKKSAGRNVPQPIEEEHPEEEEEQREEQQSQREESGTPPPTQEELRAALHLLARHGADKPWLVTAMERRVEAFHEARQVEENDAEREATPPSPVKHYKTIPKIRKKPKPWTEAEEEFLVQLVANEGAKWSSFEARFHLDFMPGRDQTAIKDKARNIMRKIIDQGGEAEFIARCPKWAEVTVGSSRRGVHGYENGKIPKRKEKAYLDMV